jgi:hypothetical protein
LVQVPTVPVSAHDLHVVLQAVAQQTPCAQKVLAHSALAAQAVPFAFLVQTLAMHTLGAAQSVSTVQVVRQALLVPHAKGSHGDVVAAWQVPVPLQVRAALSVEPVQPGPAHWVPLPYRRQAPAPLQKPSVPQVAAPASAHWFRGS